MFIHHKVIRESRQIECTLYGAITKYEAVRDLIEGLEQLGQHDALVLKINSPGGSVAVGMMIVKAIQECQALVIARIVYPSASMASIIALACDGMVMDPHTHLMFHTYSSGHGGKSGDVIQDVMETKRYMDTIDKDLLTPFLSRKELASMHEGKDIYIKEGDPDTKKRIQRHFKFKGDISV